MSLPSARADLEEVVSKAAVVLPTRHCRQVAKRAVNNGHVDSVGQKTRWNAAKRASIDPNLALHPKLLSQILIDCYDIFLQILRRRFALRPSIGAIIPRKDIDVLVKEHLDVVSV